MQKKFTLMLALAFIAQAAFSQNSQIGLSLNAWNYFGDLNQNNNVPDFSLAQFGAGLFYRTAFSENFGFRADLQYGSISGDDRNFSSFSADPILDFNSSFFNLTASLEWYFLGRTKRIRAGEGDEEVIVHKSWVPYFSLGLGASFTNPEVNSTGAPVPQDFNTTAIIIPIGLGIQYHLNKSWSLGLEGFLFASFSDYLDGVSRGEKDNDWLFNIGINLAYRF